MVCVMEVFRNKYFFMMVLHRIRTVQIGLIFNLNVELLRNDWDGKVKVILNY